MPEGEARPSSHGDASAADSSDTAGHSAVGAVVLAAGEGTRMRSATPKVLHRLAGRSLLEHAVRAVSGVASELAVVVGHGRVPVEEHLAELSGSLGREIHIAVQDEQLGTGHAVSCGLPALPRTGTVLVSYADVPLLDTETLDALLREHAAAGNAVTVLSAVVTDPTGYGRLLRDPAGQVTGIVEQKDASREQAAIDEINSGVYAFDAKVLADALDRLSADNTQGELYLTDVLSIAHSAGRRVGALVCADPWQVEGVNDRVQLARLGAELNERLLLHWMRAGVTIIDPRSVWLDCDVTLSPDVVLEPGVQLRAGTTVETGAQLGPDTTLTHCTVHSGASVVRTHGAEAEIGAGTSVGPFAYLRPGTCLGERSKIGAYVELKSTEVGPGTKVPHLSYVGDATIGEHSNIGAATVFVNYDGVAKHHTTVGSYARTGADNTFVAPVKVGAGAYTAAGSTITQDVPPGAMAVARGRQRNIENWVARRRPGTPADEAARSALAAQPDQVDGDAPPDRGNHQSDE